MSDDRVYTDTEVVAVCRSEGLVLLSTDELVPVSGWFDDGEELDGPDGAAACVAGPDSQGTWWAVNLNEFPPGRTH